MAESFIDQLACELKRDEGSGPKRGRFLVVYDDATEKPILPGSTVIGHPTVGYGTCLDTRGITEDEADYLLRSEVFEVTTGMNAFKWYRELDSTRRLVIANMAFNLGVAGVCTFHGMIAAIERRDYKEAAAHMRDSLWARQVKGRAIRLAERMETGL